MMPFNHNNNKTTYAGEISYIWCLCFPDSCHIPWYFHRFSRQEVTLMTSGSVQLQYWQQQLTDLESSWCGPLSSTFITLSASANVTKPNPLHITGRKLHQSINIV